MSKKILIALAISLLAAGCSDPQTINPPEDTPIEQDPNKNDPEKQDPNKNDPEKQDPDKTNIPDADGDTISDDEEGCRIITPDCVDTDGDTTPDYLDEDSDNDTVPDRIEANNGGDPSKPPAYGSNAELPAFRTPDADGNGILDIDEVQLDANGKPRDTDGDTIPDFLSDDNDGDTIPDEPEIVGLTNSNGESGMDCNGDTVPDEFGSLEHPIDCDGDTIPDYLDSDSDGDTVEDLYESDRDSDNDGFLDRYSQDSDGDTIPDKDERGTDKRPADSDGDANYDFQEYDSDGDGLSDADELICPDGKDSRISKDTDSDNESDLAEFAIAKQFSIEPADLICDPNKGVTDLISFYFELPASGDEKHDTLTFNPSITKADVFVNIDNTGSMQAAVDVFKQYFTKDIISAVRERVPDSQFGLSIFRDTDAKPVWQLYQPISNNDAEIQKQFDNLKIVANSTDIPEAGYEALYEIASGDTSKNSNAYERIKPPAGTIGGAGFRKGALPIILHITDAPANNNGHSKSDAINALNKIGARVITLATPFTSAGVSGKPSENWPELLRQNSIEISKETHSVVPVCAYQQDDKTWSCGENKCCTNNYCSSPLECESKGEAPDNNDLCTLAIKPSLNIELPIKGQNALIYKTVLAIEALVKYSTYTVSTRVIGEPLSPEDIVDPNNNTTACFIQKIEAVKYEPPANGVVASCVSNFDTVATDFSGKGYNDSFKNFAVGAATPDSPKSQLTFDVVAKNDNCVKPSPEVRTYKIRIEVYDPTTNMVFDNHEVFVVVPASARSSIN